MDPAAFVFNSKVPFQEWCITFSKPAKRIKDRKNAQMGRRIIKTLKILKFHKYDVNILQQTSTEYGNILGSQQKKEGSRTENILHLIKIWCQDQLLSPSLRLLLSAQFDPGSDYIQEKAGRSRVQLSSQNFRN